MYDSQTPIDIHCGKLVDWLVQRRHAKRDWGEKLASIRRKIKSALKDMPESEQIKQLLIGSKLDYFRSKEIVEILKTTEANSKNIFGYYSSQRMKDWQDIVYCYELDCVFLAELATDLIRETNYEVPGLRREIQKLKSEQDDLEKEKVNIARRLQQYNSEYRRLAQSYDIKGQNVVQELKEQLKNLPSVMDQMVEQAKSLEPSLEYYRDFSKLTTKQDSSKFLPTLGHIINKGNTTVYEFYRGEAPKSIVRASDKATSSSGASNPSEIDDEIDFGDDLPSSSESSSGFVHLTPAETNVDESFVKMEVGGSGDKIARGDDAKLLLEYKETRNQFMNELHELEAFFKQLSGDEESDATDIDARGNTKYINQIGQIIQIATLDKNRILFQMNDSASFIDNIAEKFVAKTDLSSKCSTQIDQIEDRIKLIENHIKEMESQLKKNIVAARELQAKVENSISALYCGRTINIMGCV